MEHVFIVDWAKETVCLSEAEGQSASYAGGHWATQEQFAEANH